MSSPIRPPLWITDTNGNPSGRPINKIIVSEGTLSVTGTTATVTTGGSGGTGTVTNVSSTDTFVTITNPSTTPVIVIGDSSATSTGVLTSTDWSIFNAKGDGTVTSVTSTDSYVSVASDSTTPVITIGYASTSLTGVLTSTDWNTFNNKTSNTGTVTNVQGALPIVSSGGTSPSISINKSATAADGYLSATDWNTFNNKSSQTIALTTTGTSGAATLVGSTLNIPTISGGGGGTIGGSITDNQVAVGAAASNDIEGSSDFTYNASTGILTVGEKIDSSGTNQLQLIAGSSSISILDSGVSNHINITPASSRLNVVASTLSLGTNAADATLSSRGPYNLTLNTNDGTNSGSIVIADGVNGQISITPNGTGTIKLDGVELDNSAIATGYVLKATSATAAGWAAESGGGGGFTGSLADTQVAFGDTTADSIQGSSGFTSTLGAAGTTSALKFGYSDGTTNYTRLRLNGNNAYLEFRDQSDNQKGAIGFTSTQGLKFYAKAGGLGATEAFRITPDDEWMLNGSNVGAAGDVLTSGGSAAAVTWTTPSGGTPAGSDTEIQFNNSGAFGASPDLTWDGTSLVLADAKTLQLNSAYSTSPTALNFTGDLNTGITHNSNGGFSFIHQGAIKTTFSPDGIKINSGTYKIYADGSDKLNLWGGYAGNAAVRINDAYDLPITAAGTNGQVLTGQTDGSTAWATSGGGSSYPISIATAIGINDDTFILTSMPPYSRTITSTSSQSINTSVHYIPFIPPKNLTLTNLQTQISTAGTGNLSLALYDSDAAGNPQDILTNSTITIDASTTGYYTSTMASSQSLSGLTLYYIAITMSANSCSVLSHPTYSDVTTGPVNGINTYNRPLLYDGTTLTLPSSVTPSQLSTKYGFCPLIGGGF